jgi:ribosomal protein S18 acetylase RimI-like enzyme
MEIRSLKTEDCLTIAKIHMKYLTTSFKGQAGLQLLNIYYEVIASQTGGIGLVAAKDSELVGFVCGIWDQGAIKKALMKKWSRLLIYGIKQSLQTPKIIQELLSRLFNSRILNSRVKARGYELRPIVVLPTCRGRNLADALTWRLLEDAKQRGYSQIFLLTDSNNHAAMRFYMRFGFELGSQINQRKDHVVLLYYSLSTDKVFNEYSLEEK